MVLFSLTALLSVPGMLTGCWNLPEGEELEQVPFDNPVVDTTTGVIDTVETNLVCPDGSNARFYVVHDTSATAASPVAVVLHSSSFDYVFNPDPAAPLLGPTYAGNSRISWEWGVQKVWETFGMYATVDLAEENRGALPAALLDAGVVGIYPINCWGDLWHNEQGVRPNDVQSDYIDRNGGVFAWWMVRMLFEPSFATSQDIVLRPLVDPNQLYLIGLGTGARGVTSLLSRDQMQGVQGVLLDGFIDDVDAWAQTDRVGEGLRRVYWDPDYDPTSGEAQDFREFELRYMINRSRNQGEFDAVANTERFAVVYSDLDPQVPADALGALPAQLQRAETDGAEVCLFNTSSASHVFTNSDSALADDMVDFLLNGTRLTGCEDLQ